MPNCPIEWQPCALRSVFGAFSDYGPNNGAPVPLRVFYPTLDGSPPDAPLVAGCGRYPVVVFLHGHCQGGADHYLRWEHLGMVLARSGYVAVMPQILDIASALEGQGPLDMVDQLLAWIRAGWAHQDVLLPAPSTAVIGHSYGGMLAGRYATEVGGVAALATLHSRWFFDHHYLYLARRLQGLAIPKLFITLAKAEELLPVDAGTALPEDFWNSLAFPSHRAVFENSSHWDYLPKDTACGTKSSCAYYPGSAFTILDMFLSRYLPPETTNDLYDRIPENLRPPTPLELTPDQKFFAGGNWLREIDLMAGESAWGLQLDKRVRATTFVPHVVGLNPLQAAQRVLDARLRPVVNGRGSKVVKQRPNGGHRTEVDSEVSLELGTGQIS